MGTLITACTERIFLKELMPLAHLTFSGVCAANDNKVPFRVRTITCPHREARSHLARHAPQCLAQKQLRRMLGAVYTPKRLSKGDSSQPQPAPAATHPIMA
jgi:hypothetical protein